MSTTRTALRIGRHAFIVAGAALVFPGCAEEVPPAKPVARPVKILTLSDAGATRRLEYPGEVEAGQDADVAFEVAGKIVELPVEEGQDVEAGALLARLDPRDYQSRLDAERAKSGAAKAEYDRVRALFEADVNSQQQLDRAKRQYEVTTANLERAEKALEDTRLIAPFAGTVARKLVKDFRNVQAKEPVIVLQDDSSLEIVVNVPERDLALGSKRDGERLRRVVNPRVTVSAFPDRVFPAEVSERATTADPATRTYAITLTFLPPEDLNVRPGMTASVAIEIPEELTHSGYALPARAVLMNEGSEPYVWRVDPSAMTVARATIVPGELSGDQLEIRSGLQPGDQIAVSGVHQLRDGMTVRRFED